MRHGNREAFNQVVVQSGWKLKIRTYTTDFERRLMNQAAIQFAPGVHIGCLFHLKQAWRCYPISMIKMDEAQVKIAMQVGYLDLLTIV